MIRKQAASPDGRGGTSGTRGVAGAAATQADMGMGTKDRASAAERCMSPFANAL